MLGFLKSKPDSVPPAQFLHLISDKTAPNFFWSDDNRCENRNNRTVPLSISPWDGGKPALGPMLVGITKDISDNGLCLVCPFPIEESEVVVGIYVKEIEVAEPLFFRVSVCKVMQLAKGFWQIGVRAEELLNTTYRKQINVLTSMAAEHLFLENAAE